MKRLGSSGAVAIVLFLLMPAIAWAAPSWQAPQQLSAEIGPAALDGAGNAVVSTAPYPWRYAFRPLGGALGSSTDYGPGLNNSPGPALVVSDHAGNTFAFNAYSPWLGYRQAGASSFTVTETKDAGGQDYTPIDIAVNSSGAAVGLFAGPSHTTYVAYRPPGAATSFDLDHKITCCVEASSGAGTLGEQISYDNDGGVSVVYASPARSAHQFQNYAPPNGHFGTPAQIPVNDTTDVCCTFARSDDGTSAIGWVRVSSQNSNGDGIVVATRAPDHMFGAPQVVSSASGAAEDSVDSLALAAGTDGAVAAVWQREYQDTTNCFATSGGNFGYQSAFESPGTTTFSAGPSGAHTWPQRVRGAGLAMSGHTVLLITEADVATTNDPCVNNSANETRDLTATMIPLDPGVGGSSAVVATTGTDSQGNERWPQLGTSVIGPGGQALISYLQWNGTAMVNYLRAYEDRSTAGSGGGGGGGGSGGGGPGGSGGSGGTGPPPKPPGSLILNGPIHLTQVKVVPISLQCGDLACFDLAEIFSHGVATARAGKAKKPVVLGTWKGKIAAHSKRTVQIKLTPAGRRALARLHRLTVTIVIDVRAGSRHRRITRTTTLIYKPPRKKH